MQGPWSQYRALTMHCEELPCFFDQPGRDQNSTDFIYGRYSKEVPPMVPLLVSLARSNAWRNCTDSCSAAFVAAELCSS